MWKMLIESQKGKNFQVSFSNIQQNGKIVTANWEAKYEFGKSKRKVHNKIKATFLIENGKILKHVDQFHLHSWAKQAMGFQGWLIGSTKLFQVNLTNKQGACFKSIWQNKISNNWLISIIIPTT